jgi:hypothetical protein
MRLSFALLPAIVLTAFAEISVFHPIELHSSELKGGPKSIPKIAKPWDFFITKIPSQLALCFSANPENSMLRYQSNPIALTGAQYGAAQQLS